VSVADEIHPVTPERWPDMVALFERRGPRGGYRNAPAYGCWCMYWRDRSLEHGTPKKRAMGAIVRAGREPGLLAYADGSPVGWVAVAPREEYGALLRSPQYRPHDEDTGVWSIVCFTVDRPAQRGGRAGELLAAGVEHAGARGAAAVEAYAHRTKDDDYMGGRRLYFDHGFRPVRETSSRTIFGATASAGRERRVTWRCATRRGSTPGRGTRSRISCRPRAAGSAGRPRGGWAAHRAATRSRARIGGVPVQRPGLHVSRDPTRGRPRIDGRTAFASVGAATAIGADAVVVPPAASATVTVTV
jgi:GNAT superfamily N-acetyltransferase